MSQPTTSKDPNTAMVIEIVAGYFGLLGMGYFYAGRTAAGLLRLFGFWAILALYFIVVLGLSSTPLMVLLDNPLDFEGALGASFLAMFCSLCLIPVILAVPVLSGLMLKRSLS